jgi:hypothetical protein
MSNLKSFHRLFFHALLKIQDIFFLLLGWLVVNAAAIAYFEQIPFADALYFSFVTGLTIGFVGILMTGLIAAIAVYALRETM